MPTEHNHTTRVVKLDGLCPRCDEIRHQLDPPIKVPVSRDAVDLLVRELGITDEIASDAVQLIAGWLAEVHEGRALGEQHGWATRYASYLLQGGCSQPLGIRPNEDPAPKQSN